MNEPCERIEEFLNEGTGGDLPPELRAHAAACETCREGVAIDTAMRTRLGGGIELASSHKAALADRILAAPAAGRPRIIRWPWVAALAGAAAVAAALVIVTSLPTKPVEPTRPTAIFADLLGPLPELAPEPEKPTPEPQEQDVSPIDSALAFLLGDWDGPMALGRTAIEVPLEAGSLDQPAPKTEKPARDAEKPADKTEKSTQKTERK